MAGPDGYLTIDELRRANPRQQGEGVFEYSQRIGGMLAQQNRARGGNKTPTPSIFQPSTPRGQDETNVGSFLRQNVGGAVANAFDITGTAGYMADMQKSVGQAGQQAWDYLWDTPRQQQEAVARAKPKPEAAAAFAPARAAPAPAGNLNAGGQNAIAGMAQWAKSQGATVTSTFRDAAKNKAVGGVPNSYHTTGQAFDSVPPKGMNMGQWAATVRAQVGAGWDVINEGDHVHVEPAGKNGKGSGLNVDSAFVNPFDPTYFNKAEGAIDAAGAAAKRPTSFAFNAEPEPSLPDAQGFLPTPTDFSKVNAAVEKLRPEEMEESGKLQMRRQAYFRGIGEALMNVPESAGLGKVLAAVGGGALVGSSIGDDKVRAEMEKFDQKMAQYNMAVLRNEGDQAEVRHREAAQSADFLYRNAMAKYETQYKSWARYNTPSMDAAGNIITQTKDPKTGIVTMQRIPNAAAIDAATAEKKADLFMRAGGEQNAGSRLEATARNGLVANMIAVQASQAMQSPDTAQAMVSMPAMLATQIIDGGGLDGLLQSAWSTQEGQQQGNWQQGKAQLVANAETAALAAIGQSGQVNPADLLQAESLTKVKQSPAYQDAYRRSLIQQIQMLALDPNRPGFRKKLFDMGGVYAAGAAGMAQADRRVSTRTDAKGRTLTNTTTDYGN